MIALTGATGMVGGEVLRRALAAGVSLRVLTRTPPVDAGAAEVVRVEDLAVGVPTNALRGCSVVVHSAARVHVLHDRAVDAEAAYRRANRDAAMQVAAAAVRDGVRRLVFVSTIKVLGEATFGRPFTPGDRPAPQDAYSRSKAAAESDLLEFADRTGLEVVVIRPVLVYGRGARGNLARLMKAVQRGIPLPLASIRNRRAMVSLDALGDLLLLAASRPEPTIGIWHAADLAPISTVETVRAIAAGMQRRAPLVPVPLAVLRGLATLTGRRAALARLTDSLEVDAATSEAEFGWRQAARPHEGLIAMAAGFR